MSVGRTRMLGDVTTIVGGGTPTRSNPDFYGGKIPWVTPKDMKAWEIHSAQVTITQSGLKNSATRLVPANSVLVVVRSGVLKHTVPVALNRVPVAINQDMKALQCVDGLDPDFLARFIKSRSQEILQWVRATTADNFPVDSLKKLRVPFLPRVQQRRIAKVLDRADALRAKRRIALSLFDTLTQSLFLDLFGDPATNPKRWQTSVLGNAADVQGGLQVSAARKSCPREVPYLRVANVLRRFLDLTEVKTLRATDAEIARTTLVKDDLLVVEGHGNPNEIGRAALWDGSIAGCVHQNHIIRARFKRERLLPAFACEYLNSPGGRRHLLRAGKTTSGLNTISVSEVRASPIALPPLELQLEFAQRNAAVEKLKAAHRASLGQLDALFATLQHRAFRGEL